MDSVIWSLFGHVHAHYLSRFPVTNVRHSAVIGGKHRAVDLTNVVHRRAYLRSERVVDFVRHSIRAVLSPVHARLCWAGMKV